MSLSDILVQGRYKPYSTIHSFYVPKCDHLPFTVYTSAASQTETVNRSKANWPDNLASFWWPTKKPDKTNDFTKKELQFYIISHNFIEKLSPLIKKSFSFYRKITNFIEKVLICLKMLDKRLIFSTLNYSPTSLTECTRSTRII